MNENIIEVSTINSVGLPLDPENFSRVILDFLGRKENLSYKSHDNFILNFEDISQFNHIINSKISYQKNIVLEHFSANLGYSDGTFREINTSEALNHFLETRSLNVDSINLNWKIIIKFDNSPTIETQEINLLFITNLDFNDSNETPYIELSINHTNQSWALDILNAFKEKINQIKIEQSSLKKRYSRFKKNPFFLSILMASFLSMCFALMIPIATESTQILRQDLIKYTLKQDYKDDVTKLVSLLHITSLNKNELKDLKNKDEEIRNLIDKKNKETIIQLILIVLFMITPFIIRKYIYYSINYFDHKSFIIVNTTSENELKKYKDKKSKINYISITVIISSIVLSLIAAIIFKLMEKMIF